MCGVCGVYEWVWWVGGGVVGGVAWDFHEAVSINTQALKHTKAQKKIARSRTKSAWATVVYPI